MMLLLLIFFLTFFVIIFHLSLNRNSLIRNWPVIGMLPWLLNNAWRLHEAATVILNKSRGTFVFKGPWFANMDFLITSDPMNVDHICSKRFANYPKGPNFMIIMEPLGDGILNADGDSWKIQRKMIHSLIKQTRFKSALQKTIREKLEKGLIPVLDHASEQGILLDLQQVFQRFTFDNICMLVLGFDPNCLSVEFPEVACANAYEDMEQAVLYRHFFAESYWKLLKWLQIGGEKKLSRGWKTFDKFLHECISLKRERLSRRKATVAEDQYDLLTAFMVEEEDLKEDEQTSGLRKTDRFLRDMAFSLMGAGRDTVSAGLVWFFWLVATHPSVENKILQELEANNQGGNYLRAALCETLRLYPPAPFNRRTADQADILPSGHHINQNKMVLISYYSMGRMEEIWGKDCLEFKPERWISEKGGIVHVPSYKFTPFHAGPRNCIGKDISFIQMKMVAISIIRNYRLKIAEGHPVSPCSSIILHMKHGLKVHTSKRDPLVNQRLS